MKRLQALFIAFATAVSLSFVTPGVALAETSLSEVDAASSPYDVERAVTPYVHQTADGRIVFDSTTASADGASPFVLEVGANLNEYSASMFDASNGVANRDMPGYGNWCGPGNSGPAAPTNTLDRLCMHHDKCYAARGYFSCSCDDELIANINREYYRMGTIEKGMANAIKIYFQAAPCNG